MLVIVIWFFVIVPVLSLQIMVTAPKLSAAGSFLTSMFFFASLFAPMDKLTVTMTGKEFGMVETVRARANKSIFAKDNVPCIVPVIKTMMIKEIAMIPICLANWANFACKGVWTSFVVCNEVAIFPNSV